MNLKYTYIINQEKKITIVIILLIINIGLYHIL